MKKTHLMIVILAFSAMLIGGYFGFKAYAGNEAKIKLDTMIAEHSDDINIEYRKVGVDLPGMDVRISDILVAPVGEEDKLKINELVIHDFDKNSEIPEFMSVSVNGIELDLNELGRKAEDLKALGYEGKMRISLGAAYIYKKGKKELNIDKLKISVDNAGEISMRLHVSNVGPVSRNLFSLLGMLSKLTVHKAKIVYKDASLAERMLKAAAKEEGMAPEELKAEMLDHLDGYIDAEKDKHAKELLKKVRDFVDDPDEFSISLVSEPSSAEKLMKDFWQLFTEYGKSFNKYKVKQREEKTEKIKRFLSAAKSGDAKTVKNILAQGIEIDATLENDVSFSGATALMLASGGGHVELVEYLIEKGADVNEIVKWPNFADRTALMTASFMGQAEVVRILLNNGAKVDGKLSRGKLKGQSALTIAKMKNHTDIVELIVKAEADSGVAASKSQSDKPSNIEKKKKAESAQPAKNDADQKKPQPPAIAEKPDISAVQVSGVDLKSVFRRLENAGFKPGPYQENDLGGLTEAVKMFQKFAKLKETGIIDETTWSKLKILYDPETSSGKKKR